MPVSRAMVYAIDLCIAHRRTLVERGGATATHDWSHGLLRIAVSVLAMIRANSGPDRRG